ncbi:MAG TPA: NAD-dependent malic enzyme [Oculatellaceae cyanobacterium]
MNVETKNTTTDGSLTRGKTSASYGITVRAKLLKTGGVPARVLTAIAEIGGEVEGIYMVSSELTFTIQDIKFNCVNAQHGEDIVAAVARIKDVEVMHVSDATFLDHLRGKIEVTPRRTIKSADDLSRAYTPGVARVCLEIAADPSKVYSLTSKGNMVAIVTDGSRILGLGNIGPQAGLPVMEGKAMLFKQFGGVDAFPLALGTQDTDEIVRTVKAISPGFGAINLEDIASPRCYEVEQRLSEELDIPVFHDDQHGTAIATVAAAINSAKLVKKQLRNLRVVGAGVGAAGLACAKLLMAAGVRHYVGFNVGGAIHKGRTDLTPQERWLAENSNPDNFDGTLQEALEGADMFLGLAAAGIIKAEDLAVMRRDPIVFALANPIPEVMPLEAKRYARVVATGGSDYPNQINNALVFPGFFKGLLESRAQRVTDEMKLAAARALAAVVSKDELDEDHVIPSIFDSRVAKAVASAVIEEAQKSGVARRNVAKRPR